MSFGIPVRNGLAVGLLASTTLSAARNSPRLNLNFLSMTAATFDPRITFSRGSNATLVDSTGKITYAPNNLLTYSEQFDNAAWIKTAATVNANAIVSPNGTLTADKLVESTAASQHRLGQAGATVSGVAYVFSVYLKAGERTKGWVRIFGVGTSASSTVDLTAGTISVGTGTGTITDVGNGWYRVAISGVADSATASGFVNLADAGGATTYTGDGTSGFYIWGAQLEAVTYQTTPSAYVATTSAAYYGPRFDYDPVTLAPKGLLVEEARTNLCLYSDNFTNAAWVKTSATAAMTATGPSGTTNSASTLTASGANGTVLQTITSASAARATSCYIKRRTGTGTINMTQDNGTTWAAVTVTADWTRVNIASATVTNPVVGFQIVTSGDAIDVAYFQCETGAFPTSVIPTVASTVARSADVATMTGTNFSSWFNASSGTFVTAGTPSVVSVLYRLFQVSDGTENNRISATAGSASHFIVTTGGVDQCDLDAGTFSAGVTGKLAVAYAANDFAASLNAGAVATDTSGTIPVVDRIFIAARSGSLGFLNGHIRTLQYYSTRLPNATLQALSA